MIAFAVRGILFNKTDGANWKVTWHQDCVVSVMERKEIPVEERLARYRQIKLRVIGRKSGKTISNPVWFVLEGGPCLLVLFTIPTKVRRTCSAHEHQEYCQEQCR